MTVQYDVHADLDFRCSHTHKCHAIMLPIICATKSENMCFGHVRPTKTQLSLRVRAV